MSTYLRTTRKRLNPYDDNIPLLWDYLKFSVEESRKLSLRSSNIYYVNIRLFLRYLKIVRRDLEFSQYDDMTISDLSEEEVLSTTADDISGYLAFRTDKGDSVLSLRQKMTCLYAFFSYLVNRKLLEKNPADNIPRPIAKRQAPSTLLPAEIDLILRTAHDRQAGIRDFCMASLLIFSGLNLAELCRLNTDDVQDVMQTGTIRVFRREKETFLPVSKVCQESIRDWITVRNELKLDSSEKALFVSSRTRHRITARQVEKIFSACFSISGLSEKGYNIATLRNTAVVIQKEQGKSTAEIARRLGHRNEKSTKQMLKVFAPTETNQQKEDKLNE